MSTWTTFYVETDNIEIVVDELKKLTGISETKIGDYPSDIYDNYLFDETAKPNYLAIGLTNPSWVTISHNSFNNLFEWSKIISQNLQVKVIVTIAQSVSDVYYFSMYDKGQKVREIQVCYSDDSKPKNFGQPFDFENEKPGKKLEYDDEIEYYFGFEEIEDYCKRFGLAIQIDYDKATWTILKSGVEQKTISDFVNTELEKTKKPWWKFW